MKQNVLRAFGYIIVQNDWEQGEVFSDDYCVNNKFNIKREVDSSLTPDQFREQDFNHIWLITKGRIDVVEEDTGNVCVRRAGFCTLDVQNQIGDLELSIVEPTQLFCLSANRNLKRTPIIPALKSFKLLAGETYTTHDEMKLFLAAGELQSGVINATGPSQIQIGSNKVVTAMVDCYGLVFL